MSEASVGGCGRLESIVIVGNESKADGSKAGYREQSRREQEQTETNQKLKSKTASR